MKTKAGLLIMAGVAVALAGCQTVRDARDRWVKAPPRCEDQTVHIYFEPDQAEVTPEGRSVIAAAAGQSRGCIVERVSVVGLSDATGNAAANLELSKRRAQSVTAALVSAQLPAAEFRVSAAGQEGAVTADGRTAPLRRRADVTLHMKR
jgi:Outer membrane protein and related peptidoglycan-associated (lipo)proteins